MLDGNDFTTSQKTSLSTGTAEGALSVSVYTVSAIAVSDGGSYTCSAGYQVGEVESTVVSPTPVSLTVLGKIYFTRLFLITHRLQFKTISKTVK